MQIIWQYLILLLISVPAIILIAFVIRKYKKSRFYIIFLHALVLVFLTLFVFSKPTWKWIDYGRGSINNQNDQKALNYIHNNFLLVDNSFDKTLTPYLQGSANDSSVSVITNRNTLISLFDLLYQKIDIIDFVVMDLGLSDQTPQDSLLGIFASKLYAENKIVFCINPYDEKSIKLIQADDSIYGTIAQKTHEKLFTSHTIISEDYTSLPYIIYQKIHNTSKSKTYLWNSVFVESSENGISKLALNNFTPQFKISDEKYLHDNTEEAFFRSYYLLSQTLTGGLEGDFSLNLSQRKTQGKKNIIFIGSFASPNEDIHQTLFGNLHGPTIILNVLYNLKIYKHVITFGFLLKLLMGYLIISSIIIMNCLGRDFFPEVKWLNCFSRCYLLPQNPSGFLKILSITWNFIFEFFFKKNLSLTILVLFSLLISKLTGRIFNIFSLFYYFGILIFTLHFARYKLTKSKF